MVVTFNSLKHFIDLPKNSKVYLFLKKDWAFLKFCSTLPILESKLMLTRIMLA